MLSLASVLHHQCMACTHWLCALRAVSTVVCVAWKPCRVCCMLCCTLKCMACTSEQRDVCGLKLCCVHSVLWCMVKCMACTFVICTACCALYATRCCLVVT